MFAAYPAAGLLIGALLSALYLGASFVFPGPLAVLIVIAGSIFLTGAMHLDGLADCSDAFYGKRDRETTLRILKDPRIGTMGGCAIGLSPLARMPLFRRFPSAWSSSGSFSQPCFPARLSSWRCACSPMSGMKTESSARGRRARQGSSWRSSLAPPLPVLLPIPAVMSALALALFWRISWKRIGGCTGDVLGASIEIAEIVFFVTLAATAQHALPLGVLPRLLGWGGS